jgi:A/G-specific adenine glycosylase
MVSDQIRHFRRALLRWYGDHARDLPWRRTRDPYLIWISEIMLQQTRVAAVLEHYARFTKRFPAVDDLAVADEADVLAQWSGLGYYRRARMMHRAAQAVMKEHGGMFPRTAKELVTLPGIGAYTAAAVASIAFGEIAAVVDGNVERVLTRVAGWDVSDATAAKKAAVQIRLLAQELIDPQEPSHFNQAMMELGATICLPRRPLCLQCPVQALCATRGEHPTVKRKPLTPHDAFYALVEKDGLILLEQRPAEASLMAGMWQLPQLETAPDGKPLCTIKHSITVTNYTVRVYAQKTILPAESFAGSKDWHRRWIPLESASTLPLTGLARKILRRLRSFEMVQI